MFEWGVLFLVIFEVVIVFVLNFYCCTFEHFVVDGFWNFAKSAGFHLVDGGMVLSPHRQSWDTGRFVFEDHRSSWDEIGAVSVRAEMRWSW